MVNTYNVLKTIHVLAAITWLGGGIMLMLLWLRVKRIADPAGRAMLFQSGTWLAPRAFVPASLVLVITGFWMVGNGDLHYDTWVILAIIGWGITFLTGNALLAPMSKKGANMLTERGPTDPEAMRLIDRFFIAARIDLVVLALVVIDMVIKPGQ